MSAFVIPFAKQDLLHQVLTTGGTAICPLYLPTIQLDADIDVELSTGQAHVKVKFGAFSGSLTLPRGDRANHLHLRDFIEDVANGRTTTGRTKQAIALMEALDHISTALLEGQVAYIAPTTNAEYPFGAVVTNGRGELCAAAIGTDKEHLAELLRDKLRPHPEGNGEKA